VTISGEVENADHTTMFVTGSAYYGPSWASSPELS
jgi:hypothetical protein